MKNTLLFLAAFATLFCSNTDARADTHSLGEEVVWYRDTTGDSPLKKPLLGLWFAPDGKIVVPQGNQLFILDPATGNVDEKIDVDCTIEHFCAANDRFLLVSDTTLYVYDKTSYKLIKKIGLPIEISNRPESYFFRDSKSSDINKLSPDGRTIVVGYNLKSGRTEMWKFDVETSKYEMIKHSYLSLCTYSPDGKYFIANEEYGSEGVRPVIYKADDLKNSVFDTKKFIECSGSNFNFSSDSKIFYFSYQYSGGKLYSIDLSAGFKLDSVSIKANTVSCVIGINDSLSYVNYGNNFSNYGCLMNLKRNVLLYRYNSFMMSLCELIPPNKEYMIQFGYTYFFRATIPYDYIYKTEVETQIIDGGLALSPNPANEIVNYSFCLTKDQNIKYSISQIDGTEIKSGELGICAAGNATGSFNLQDIPVGEYIVVFYGEEGKVGQCKICLVR